MNVRLGFRLYALLLFVYAGFSQADQVDDFIDNNRVKTFDCPSSEISPRLDRYLQRTDLSPEQFAGLRLLKSHSLICVGQYVKAQTLLTELVDSIHDQQDGAIYAGAIYQLGFILDVQENPQRCDFYRQAEALAKDKFTDIYLSSQLGQITVCNHVEMDISLKLNRLFALLEEYAMQGDEAAVAHIHNNIGLLYGSIGQNELAAEQYLKSYQMGLSVYDEKNQLATLMSLNSANIAAGDFEAAKDSIEMLRKANLKVNTPLSNVWLHFSESRYYFRLGDFDGLRNSLIKLRLYLPKVSLNSIKKAVEWYSAALCIHDGNTACVESYLDAQQQLPAREMKQNMANRDYLKVIVNSHFMLGNYQQAQDIFNVYTEVMTNKILQQQRSGRVLGVAQLHGQITSLENKVQREKQQKYLSVLIVSVSFIVFLVFIYLFFVKRYILTVSTDPLTGLPNERALLSELKRVAFPEKGRINALALCDVSNFKQLNSQYGHLTGDLALINVASCLRKITRDSDLIGRIGVGQFIVCLKGIDEVLAKEFFERIEASLQRSFFQSDKGEQLNIESNMSIYMTLGRFDDLEDVLSDLRDSLELSRKRQEQQDEVRA